nr:hypothetical protein [uncultured Dyadobacter sp.]
MRRIASIGLLVLLLCNTFGLSLAILFFEKDYLTASSEGTAERVMKMYLPSLPYSGNLEISQQMEGLIRQDDHFYNATQIQHENDTLYVTLQSNQAARDHFFQLANAMQVLNDPQSDGPQSPYGKAVKLLGDLLKTYVSDQPAFDFSSVSVQHQSALAHYRYAPAHYLPYRSLLASPPPETV